MTKALLVASKEFEATVFKHCTVTKRPEIEQWVIEVTLELDGH